ncbi:transmembrane protein 54a [Cololabis saira]|uniref:transmembrane protein 54a n=1 Tax=Cololabis saira TaxID=129043 RepID=UPI002AD3EFD0|nr:transmembrane protein 54a [Cololabis saira]
MVNSGICCANLKDNKALMKMGLALVLVGHVNFLLGALVHGAVLRHIKIQATLRTIVYTTSNVIAIVEGLVGIICGIIAIFLSKNKKNRILKWVLLFCSFLAGLLGIAAALSLSISTIKAIIHEGKSLLELCQTQDIDSSSITNECPFDPTRLYGTTIILWVPLIVMSIVELVFCFRCFAACTSFLYLCPCRRKPVLARRVRIQARTEIPTPRPEPDEETGAEEEPVEQDELLDRNTVVEQSDWL